MDQDIAYMASGERKGPYPIVCYRLGRGHYISVSVPPDRTAIEAANRKVGCQSPSCLRSASWRDLAQSLGFLFNLPVSMEQV